MNRRAQTETVYLSPGNWIALIALAVVIVGSVWRQSATIGAAIERLNQTVLRVDRIDARVQQLERRP